MFGFRRKKRNTPESPNPTPEQNTSSQNNADSDPKEKAEAPGKNGFFAKLKQGLARTRASLTDGLATMVMGKKTIDAASLEEIETQLLLADVGVDATQRITDDLTQRLSRKQLKDGPALINALRENLIAILAPHEQTFSLQEQGLTIILMVGINGAGKTTTIGKLAKRLQNEGKQVMLAAGDTFRAAAVEQLQVWGERNQIAVVAQPGGKDSASVIYDGMEAAKARDIDVLIADTAGRLHTQTNLMEELKKVIRVIKKIDPDAPHEVLLVLDAGIGQNALNQAKEFHNAVGVSGLVLTKLDGTAKGGIIFAIANALNIPIRYIGVGEGIDDLRPFVAEDFVDALLTIDTPSEDNVANQ